MMSLLYTPAAHPADNSARKLDDGDYAHLSPFTLFFTLRNLILLTCDASMGRPLLECLRSGSASCGLM